MITKRSIRIPALDQSREPLFAFLIAMAVGLLIVFAVAGCRDAPNTTTALDVANRALVGVDIATDILVDNVAQAREARVAACRDPNLAGERERADCMGKFAEPLEPKVEAAGRAYDAIVQGLDDLANAIGELEELQR